MTRWASLLVIATIVLLSGGAARAQERFGPPPELGRRPASDATPAAGQPSDAINPISALAGAGAALPGSDGAPSKGLSTALNVMLVLTVITLAPSIVLMCTSFLRIIVVLGLLKQAIGTQQLPPAQVITGLALVMTLLVMAPVIDRINREAVGPYQRGEITNYDQLWGKARQPLRDFMFDQLDATGNHTSLLMILNTRGIDTSKPERLTRESVDMISLVPAFVLSELKVAFLMGFKVYLPFLVIDMVISSLLISMSMMMLPPVLISLPFKLLLFVLVDGWQLVVGSLMASFAHLPPPPPPASMTAAFPMLEPLFRLGLA